jgi:Retroviral aspartyl protease
VWVDELSNIEHSEEVTKLLHKERNTESRSRASASSSSTPSKPRYDRHGRATPTKASLPPTGDSKPTQMVTTVVPYRTSNGATGGGSARPHASNACHACGQVGHYRGDPKCPMKGTQPKFNSGKFPNRNYNKTNRLNAVAFDEPSDLDGDDEDGFDGSQYDPDDDPAYAENEPLVEATEDETPRLGTLRLRESNGPWRLNALRNEESDEIVANALEKGVRDTYEGQPGYFNTKGPKSSPQASSPAVSKTPAGTKLPHKSTTPVDSRLRYKVADSSSRPNRDRRCLVAEVEVDGVAALTLFDSGSQVDAISPDFARALQLDHFKLERTMPLQLGTKGSHATFSYEVEPTLSYQGASFGTRRIDVINIDRYDLLLGAPFFNHHKVVLDFQDRVIRAGDVIVPSISNVEETSILAKRKSPAKGSA